MSRAVRHNLSQLSQYKSSREGAMPTTTADAVQAFTEATTSLAALLDEQATIGDKIEAASLKKDRAAVSDLLARQRMLPSLIRQAQEGLPALEVPALDAQMAAVEAEARPTWERVERAQQALREDQAELSEAMADGMVYRERLAELRARRTRAWRQLPRAERLAGLGADTAPERPRRVVHGGIPVGIRIHGPGAAA